LTQKNREGQLSEAIAALNTTSQVVCSLLEQLRETAESVHSLKSELTVQGERVEALRDLLKGADGQHPITTRVVLTESYCEQLRADIKRAQDKVEVLDARLDKASTEIASLKESHLTRRENIKGRWAFWSGLIAGIVALALGLLNWWRG